MARRSVGVGLAVLGLVVMVLGIGSGTLWAPEPNIVAKVTLKSPGAVVVSAPGVLQLVDKRVTVSADGPPEAPVLIAVGRADEVNAWAAGIAHTTVTGLASWDALATTLEEGEAAAPNPAGSDLWHKEATGTGKASLKWESDSESVAVLVASDGTQPAPTTLTFTWPNDASTPWMIPGIILGLLLAGVGAAVLLKQRKSDGSVEGRAGVATRASVRGKKAAPSVPEDGDIAQPAPALPALTPDGLTAELVGQPMFKAHDHYGSLPPELSEEGASEPPSVFGPATGSQAMTRKERRRAETGQIAPIQEPILTGSGSSAEVDSADLLALPTGDNQPRGSSPSSIDAVTSSPNVLDDVAMPSRGPILTSPSLNEVAAAQSPLGPIPVVPPMSTAKDPLVFSPPLPPSEQTPSPVSDLPGDRDGWPKRHPNLPVAAAPANGAPSEAGEVGAEVAAVEASKTASGLTPTELAARLAGRGGGWGRRKARAEATAQADRDSSEIPETPARGLRQSAHPYEAPTFPDAPGYSTPSVPSSATPQRDGAHPEFSGQEGDSSTMLSSLRSRLRRNREVAEPQSPTLAPTPNPVEPVIETLSALPDAAHRAEPEAPVLDPVANPTTRADSWRRAWGVESSGPSHPNDVENNESEEL